MTSGRPDWFGTIVAAGKYDSTFIPIALDVDGFITATMKGAYDAVLKTIAVDSDGVIKANLSAQDLSRLTMRPSYGPATRGPMSDSLTTLEGKDILTVEGEGIIYGGYLRSIQVASHKDDYVRMSVDGATFETLTFEGANERGLNHAFSAPFWVSHYDDTGYDYCFAWSPNITFDTSIIIYYKNEVAAPISIVGRLFYALIV